MTQPSTDPLRSQRPVSLANAMPLKHQWELAESGHAVGPVRAAIAHPRIIAGRAKSVVPGFGGAGIPACLFKPTAGRNACPTRTGGGCIPFTSVQDDRR